MLRSNDEYIFLFDNWKKYLFEIDEIEIVSEETF